MHVFKSFVQPITVNVVLIASYIALGKIQESELDVLSSNQLSGPYKKATKSVKKAQEQPSKENKFNNNRECY